MNSADENLSHALVDYLGYELSPFPESGQRLQAPSLRGNVESILGELSNIEIDWQQHDLVSAGKLARLQMAAKLSPEALDALEWKFTYDRR